MGTKRRMAVSLSASVALVAAVAGTAGARIPEADFGDAPVQFGPTADTDARHRINISGSFTVPGGVRVSPIYLWRSALPISLVDGRDLNLDGDAIGCISLGESAQIEEGDLVKQTGQILSIPVGDGFLGRVIDPLGALLAVTVFAVVRTGSWQPGAMLAGADRVLPIVFVAIFGTVLIYGLTSPLVARRLGVAAAEGTLVLIVGGHEVARAVASALKRAGVGVRLWAGPAAYRQAAQAEGLDAEAVEPSDPGLVQGGEDVGDLGGGLAAADRADPDQAARGEVDPGTRVAVGAAQVVFGCPALHDRDDR